MIERLSSGFHGLRESIACIFPRLRPVTVLGSYVGDDTMHSTSPVDGSMATMLPIFPSRSLSPSACSFMSRLFAGHRPAVELSVHVAALYPAVGVAQHYLHALLAAQLLFV